MSVLDSTAPAPPLMAVGTPLPALKAAVARVSTAPPHFLVGHSVGWLRPQFDMNSYWGRLRYYFRILNPLNEFVGHKQFQSSLQLLKDYATGQVAPNARTQARLHDAVVLRDAFRHPLTGDDLPPVFRRTWFFPCNIPLAAGILLSPQTVGWVFFWQWLNQTLNTGSNLANANKSTPLSPQQLGTTYALSCGAALAVIMGAKPIVAAVQKSRLASTVPGRVACQVLMPLLSMQAAGVVGLYLSRRVELTDGVAVYDADGNKIGKSVVAAKKALSTTAISRIALAAITVVCPTLVYALAVRRRPALLNDFKGTAAVKLAALAPVLLVALPLASALAPPVLEVPLADLEPELQRRVPPPARVVATSHRWGLPSAGLPPAPTVMAKAPSQVLYCYRGL